MSNIPKGELRSRGFLFEGLELILLALAWMVLPTDLLSFLTYCLGSGTVAVAFELPYSRTLENEADKIGIELAAKANYICFID